MHPPNLIHRGPVRKERHIHVKGETGLLRLQELTVTTYRLGEGRHLPMAPVFRAEWPVSGGSSACSRPGTDTQVTCRASQKLTFRVTDAKPRHSGSVASIGRSPHSRIQCERWKRRLCQMSASEALRSIQFSLTAVSERRRVGREWELQQRQRWSWREPVNSQGVGGGQYHKPLKRVPPRLSGNA